MDPGKLPAKVRHNVVRSFFQPLHMISPAVLASEVFSLVQDSGSSQLHDDFPAGRPKKDLWGEMNHGNQWEMLLTSGHLAHGLALGDWSCSSIWSGSEIQHTL